MKNTPQSSKTAVAGSSKGKVAKSAKKPTNQVLGPLASDRPSKQKETYSPMGSFEVLGTWCGEGFPRADKVALLASILHRESSDGAVEEAVRTALRIYDCYYYWMERDKNPFSKTDEEAVMRYGQETFTFQEAITKITGQIGKPKRAFEYFEDFSNYRINLSPDLNTRKETVRYFDELKAHQTESSISASQVFLLEKSFANYFPTRRKKSKKKP